MKLLKKSLCVFLCVLLIASTAICAFASEGQNGDPLIFVTGMSTLPLYLNRGKADERRVWPPVGDDIVDAVVGALPALIKLMFTKNYDAACDEIVPLVNDIIGVLALNDDGTSKYDVTCSHFDKPYSYYEENYDAEFFAAGREIAPAAAEKIGGDNVYIYVYDWRLATVDLAAGLDTLVKKVKSDTGADKVNLAAISQGGTVTATYLSLYGCGSVGNTVMLSSAFCGLEQVGDLYSGRVSFDLPALLNKITDSAGDNAKADASKMFVTLLQSSGLIKIVNTLANRLIANTGDRIFDECMVPAFGTLGGIWGLVPAHDYEQARSFMFGSEQPTVLMSKVDRYYNEVSSRVDDVLNNCMDAGMTLALLANYDLQTIPFGDDPLLQSDGVIETVCTSGGAICAHIGETLTAEQAAVTSPCGHNHLSPDNTINAATAMFPEQTWFVRGMAHTNFSSYGNINEFLLTLITADEQKTVFDDPDYPQFMQYDRKTRSISPITGEISKYYFVDTVKDFFAGIIKK